VNLNQQNTAFLEERLGERLTHLAQSDSPVSTVTVAEVIDSGRRRVRRRTRTFALSAALVGATALAIGTVAVVGPGRTGSTPSGGSSGTAASIGADPLAPTVAFGWLPASFDGAYAVQQSATGPNYKEPVDALTGFPPTDGPGVSMVEVWGPQDASLTAAASVADPGSAANPGAGKVPAGTVRGHQAWWASAAPGSAKAASDRNLVLAWQYEPDAWASISYLGQQATAAEGKTMLQVANGLVIGPAHPTALSFSLPALPAGMHVDAADVNLLQMHGAKVGTASLRLCVSSPCSPASGGLVVVQQATSWTGNSYLGVEDAPLPDTQQMAGTVDQGTSATVNGHAAQLWTSSKAATITFNDGDAIVTISAADAEYRALGGLSGFLAFCRSLSWYGSNPAHWTTDVIR
jgi:hypothetical protein